MNRQGTENSSGNSNILGDLPNFFMRVPIVSNVGSLSYGLVSGVAGTGMRAAAGVYDAVVNRNPNSNSRLVEEDGGVQPLSEKHSGLEANPLTGAANLAHEQSIRRHSSHQNAPQSLPKNSEMCAISSTTRSHKHAHSHAHAPSSQQTNNGGRAIDLINDEFVNLDFKDLKVCQIRDLLESYKLLANFYKQNN
ncbi:hypothetical protein AYI70_g9992 [Smittium culicis]|uniref:Uncharacterized protein n=1 Tax=Smittium culicis TaxID=133412 RepID=A0A1R1X8K5_9FUNG|nr:hypothetical protein AYI70_g9992 [Smittium culicis]